MYTGEPRFLLPLEPGAFCTRGSPELKGAIGTRHSALRSEQGESFLENTRRVNVTVSAISRCVAPCRQHVPRAAQPSPPASPGLPLPRGNPVPLNNSLPGPPSVSGMAPLSVVLGRAHFTRHHVLAVRPCCGRCQVASHVQAEEWRVLERASSKRKPRPRHARVHQARLGGARRAVPVLGPPLSPEPVPLGDAGPVWRRQGPSPSAGSRSLAAAAAAALSCHVRAQCLPRRGAAGRRGRLCVVFDPDAAHEQ